MGSEMCIRDSVCGTNEVVKGSKDGIDGISANEETEVSEQQGSGDLVSGCGGTVLPWPEKKEICKEHEVSDGSVSCIEVGRMESRGGVEESNRSGFYSDRRRVLVAISSHLPGESGVKKGVERCEAGVNGPHIGERLRHRLQGCSNAISADGLAAEAEAAVPDSGGKHLEDWDFVRDRGK